MHCCCNSQLFPPLRSLAFLVQIMVFRISRTTALARRPPFGTPRRASVVICSLHLYFRSYQLIMPHDPRLTDCDILVPVRFNKLHTVTNTIRLSVYSFYNENFLRWQHNYRPHRYPGVVFSYFHIAFLFFYLFTFHKLSCINIRTFKKVLDFIANCCILKV